MAEESGTAQDVKTEDVEITPEMEEELNAMGKGDEENDKEVK